jgi:DNA ligase (NAD+)
MFARCSRLSTRHARTTHAALRVGAKNGDSRANRPHFHRYDDIPLGKGPNSPFIPSESKARYKAESAARERYVQSMNPGGNGPDRQWGGDVCEGPAAMLLHTLRARWIDRVRTELMQEPLDPLGDDIPVLYIKLIEEIRLCDEAYYGPNPTNRIRDEEYDELVMHLLELERIYPELIVENSPSKVVGHAAAVPRDNILTPVTLATALAQRFPPHRHCVRMLSLANAYSPEDITAFLKRAAKILDADDALASIRADSSTHAKSRNEELDASELTRDPRSTQSSELQTLTCCVEIKVDGVALALSYRNGKLVTAATRGDGIIGDCITDNVRASLLGRGVPDTLPEPVDVDVRGEVYIRPDEFTALNLDERLRLTNPRNAAAGGLKHKDPQESAKRMLRFVAYECLRVPTDLLVDPVDVQENLTRTPVTAFWDTQVETLEGLLTWGFDSMPIYQLCQTEDEIQVFASKIEFRRSSLPFEADGVVVKVNDSRVRDSLGSTAKAPRGAIALKFASVGSVTKVESVVMQVSRTGVITPVANLEPVSIGGVRVARATLHNFDEIARLGIAVNDLVVVQRGGDVIPKIAKVQTQANPEERKPILIPEHCPSCKGPVTVKKDGGATVVECEDSDKCTAQTLGRLKYFCSRDAMDIAGIGVKTAVKLLESGIVVTPADLFTISVESIMRLEGFQERSAEQLHLSIADAATNRSLERLVVALGIPGVGRASARALAVHAGSIEGLIGIGQRDSEHLLTLPHVAEKSAHSIHAFLSEPKSVDELLKLARHVSTKTVADGILEESPAAIARRIADTATDNEDQVTLEGKTFAFTGRMEVLSRPLAMKEVRDYGGKVVSIVSKKTNYVVSGSAPGLKHHKALRLGVRILTEDDFRVLLASVKGEVTQD